MPPQALETFVDGAVQDAMQSDQIAGVTVAVVQNGQIVLTKGYGAAKLQPIVPVDANRTLFRIASISKTFTWLLMAQQIEAGRYGLDTPVNELLPTELRIPEQGFDEPIRIRHLMTHSAGFEDKALGQLFEDDAEDVRGPLEYLQSERPRRVREPGRLSTYSNYGVALAGAIVARTDGRPYEQVLEQRLLRPLRMERTSVREPYPPRNGLPAPLSPALAASVSAGFSPSQGAFKAHSFEYITQIGPAGGLSTTSADMARYMLAILNGGALDGAVVFGPRTAEALRRPLLRAAPDVNGWAYGFNEYALPGGLRGFGHGGATSYFLSNMVLVPDLGTGVFVSTNTSTGRAFANRLPGLIVERFYGQPRVGLRPGSAALKNHEEVYAGAYMTTRRPYSGLEKFVYAFEGAAEVSVNDAGRLVLTGGGRPSQWSPTGEPGRFIRADGDEILRFVIEDGEARSYYAPWGGAASERTPFHRTADGIGAFGGLAVAASLLAIVGAFMRIGRDIRPTGPQRLSNGVLLAASVLWIASAILLMTWVQALQGDPAYPLYNWPSSVGLASWCALLATLLVVILLVLLVRVWRGGDRRGVGWSIWRKLRHTTAVVVMLGFALVLLLNGGLEPWSG